MNVNEVKKRAVDLGVKVMKGLKKADMIHAIQKAEGNNECFGHSIDFCGQNDCAWRKDCLKNTKH